MSSTPDDQQENKEREAFVAEMKRRMEQAQARGESPEQIREQAAAYAHEAARQEAPRTVAKARSCWVGFRNFLIVGAIAFGLAIGLALFVERSYALPLCEKYAAQHSLVYRGVDYPVVGNSSSTTSSGSCIFEDAAGQRNTVRLRDLDPNAVLSLLASFGLQIDFTTPTFFIIVALIAVGISRLR
jgi:hypothetical protein